MLIDAKKKNHRIVTRVSRITQAVLKAHRVEQVEQVTKWTFSVCGQPMTKKYLKGKKPTGCSRFIPRQRNEQ